MSKPNEERDIYYIPPNFLASGRLFGGMIRARNAIEACVLVLLTGIPIIKLPMSLTVRIIILCLLPLPLGIFGIIGFEGDSLSEFAINWVRWFIHRRNLYRSDVTIPETARKQKKRIWEQEATKPPEELGIRIKQPRKKRKRPAKTEKQLNKNNRKMVPSHKKQVTYSEDFVPVKDIRNGIIEMEDGRYIRVLEVEPINFLLRSTSEQKNIVASFASWMKISPIKIQIKVLTKKADIGKHLSTIERDMESESMTILSSTPLVRSTVRTGSKSILALRKVNPIMRRNLNMKLNRLLTLCCALSMALGMVTFASAADYSFKTSPDPVYYGSTNYEDLYDAEYRYGSRNQIDYDIPEIQYGLSQEFLESSLNNPYLNGNTQYGFGGSSSNTQYPESDFGSSSIISGGGTIEMPYEPSVTLNDLKQSDGSIGQVSIERVGLNCKVYEGATDSSMSKGAGHYTSSGLYTGNVGLFGHNRGNHPYFGKLKNVKVGDIVKYKTAIGTKIYKVTFVGAISYTDFSYLNEMGDNRITLITCIANQPSLRLCVQAVEIR